MHVFPVHRWSIRGTPTYKAFRSADAVGADVSVWFDYGQAGLVNVAETRGTLGIVVVHGEGPLGSESNSLWPVGGSLRARSSPPAATVRVPCESLLVDCIRLAPCRPLRDEEKIFVLPTWGCQWHDCSTGSSDSQRLFDALRGVS